MRVVQSSLNPTMLSLLLLILIGCVLLTPLLILLCLNSRRRPKSPALSVNAEAEQQRAPLLASDQAPQTFVRVRTLVMRQSDARRDASIERAARQFNRATDLRFVSACVQLGERPTVAHFRLIDAASRVEYLLAVHSDCARRPLFAAARVPADRMRAAASVLGKLRMSGLLPVERVAWAADRDTLFMVVPLVRTGSLRDALRRLDPLTSIASKRRAVGQPCASEPAPFFVDLLSTMRLLARIGVPLHHLHAGNVLINVDGRPWLDVSSSLLGEPPRYADLMRHFGAKSAHAKQRGAPVEPAVVAFGAVVYEFYAGDEMESIEQIGNANLPPFVRKVLARIFLPNGEPPTLATLTDTFTALPGGVVKHRTYRDKTAQLDAADVELLAQACKAADAWVKRGGVDDATKGDIVVAVVDTSSSGKKHRSSSEKSSSGAPTTPRNGGDAPPRAKRKKKRPAYATGDVASDDGQSSLSATPVATPREQLPDHQV